MSFPTLQLSEATRAALRAMHISEPTPIQAKTLPLLLAGKDVIGQARTGSGKTLAFAIPMVEGADPALKAVQALVLVPTRELAQQVGQVVAALGRESRVRTALIFGGKAFGPQVSALNAGPQIVVGTPGRVLDLLRQGIFKPDRIGYLVLDEADEMLDRGFAPDVERILGFMPTKRQTALFSATVPDWVNQTAHKHLHEPELVRIDMRPEDAPKIEHVIYDVDEGQKLPVLRVLLDRRDDDSVLVFGRTKHGVKKLAKQLAALGYPAAALQGNLSQNARDAVMADFRSRRVPILLATNVAARGLDVEHIGLVINYELPETTDLLTHRVGRTGRMGREGDAVTLLAPSDDDKWRQLSRELKVRIPRKQWTGETPSTPAAVHAIPLYEPRPPRRAPASPLAPHLQRAQASPLPPKRSEMSPRPPQREAQISPRPPQREAQISPRPPQREAQVSPRPPQRERARERVPEAAHSPALPRRQTITESERKTGRTWQQDRELLHHEELRPTAEPGSPHLASPTAVGEEQRTGVGDPQEPRRRRPRRRRGARVAA